MLKTGSVHFEGTLECNLCSLKVAEPRNHVTSEHLDEPLFQCILCDEFQVSHEDGLEEIQKHIEVEHRVDRGFSKCFVDNNVILQPQITVLLKYCFANGRTL